MADTAKARVRRLQKACGELGKASVQGKKQGTKDAFWVYKISCRECSGIGGTTYRSGHPNTYMDAISRWNRHIIHVHPDLPAPPSMQIEADAIAAHGYEYESVRQRNERLFRQASAPMSVDELAGLYAELGMTSHEVLEHRE